jgi:hypothetical protein
MPALRGFGHEYGAGPLHLLSALASFAVAGWAFVQVFQLGAPFNFLLWFAAAIVAHDLVERIAHRLAPAHARPAGASEAAPAPSALNHVRVPAALSGLLLLLFFPLVLGVAEDGYAAAAGLSTDVYLGRWLLLSGVFFLASGVVYAIRRGRAARA